jgi:hypothetical protein
MYHGKSEFGFSNLALLAAIRWKKIDLLYVHTCCIRIARLETPRSRDNLLRTKRELTNIRFLVEDLAFFQLPSAAVAESCLCSDFVVLLHIVYNAEVGSVRLGHYKGHYLETPGNSSSRRYGLSVSTEKHSLVDVW